jgi:hypothetical protein
MAFLTPLQNYLLTVKYALHLNKLFYLGEEWFKHIKSSEINRKLSNLSLIGELPIARMAANFNLNPHICGMCGGHEKIVFDPETLKDTSSFPDWIKEHAKAGGALICPECLGVGKRPQSMRQRARIMGVNPVTWSRKYEPIFKELVDELAHIEISAARILRKHL